MNQPDAAPMQYLGPYLPSARCDRRSPSRWLLLTLLVAATSACSAAYRDPQARTPGQATDDLAIVTKVKTRLLAESAISGLRINVDVHQRVVTLRGKVPAKPLIDRAVELARSVKGVRSVRNELVLAAR